MLSLCKREFKLHEMKRYKMPQRKMARAGKKLNPDMLEEVHIELNIHTQHLEIFFTNLQA